MTLDDHLDLVNKAMQSHKNTQYAATTLRESAVDHHEDMDLREAGVLLKLAHEKLSSAALRIINEKTRTP